MEAWNCYSNAALGEETQDGGGLGLWASSGVPVGSGGLARRRPLKWAARDGYVNVRWQVALGEETAYPACFRVATWGVSLR